MRAGGGLFVAALAIAALIGGAKPVAAAPPEIPKSTALPPAPEAIPQPSAKAPEKSPPGTNSLGMKFALLPVGEFVMGSGEHFAGAPVAGTPKMDEAASRANHEGVSTSVSMPVTQQEFQQVMKVNPSWFSAKGGGSNRVSGLDTSRFPVEQVSWDDAQEFCRRLGVQEKKTYRLPTEAEWEYACRAGTSTAFSFGDSLNGTQANCNGNLPFGPVGPGPFLKRTTAVGSYKPNAWGLYDMQGNVWQWCSDWFDPNYYPLSQQDDPPGPVIGRDRSGAGRRLGCGGRRLPRSRPLEDAAGVSVLQPGLSRRRGGDEPLSSPR